MRRRLAALICFSISLAIVEPGSLPSAAGVRQEPSPDPRLQLQIEGGRTEFHIGEIIPLKLSFTSATANKYQITMATYDRCGRMHFEQFKMEPQSGWSDPLQTYFGLGGYMEGGLSTSRFLSQDPAVVSLDLNEWVRFDRAGKYSLRVISSRCSKPQRPNVNETESPELISNQLDLVVIPATKAWQDETLKNAVAKLNAAAATNTISSGQPTEGQTALKTLRHLGTIDAARELARRLRGDDPIIDFQCMFGLVGSPHRDFAMSEMRRLLVDPDQPISSLFVYALGVLMRKTDQTAEQLASDEPRNRENIRSELLAAISHKRGKALALALNTFLETADSHGGRLKPVSEQMASQVVAVFDQLPVEKQIETLEYRWDMVKGPAFLPVLRKYAEQYRDFPVPNEMNAYNSLHLSATALKRWYELEPDQARAAVLKEILRSNPRYPAKVLGILPEATLPEVEQALASHFAAESLSDGAENVASLLQRYATASVLPQVLPVIDKNVGKCACTVQTPMLAYLLRVNPGLARPRIEAAMAARGSGHSGCNQSLLVELGALQRDPMLEEIAIGALNDDDAQVAANSATFLGQYGSSAAEEVLWERLIQWSEKWRGKEDELRDTRNDLNESQRALGMNLILAIGRGRAWFTDESKLQKLRQIAIGPDVDQIDNMLSGWKEKPWTISYYRVAEHMHFRLLQFEMDSIKELEEKLGQFPKGSTFFISAGGYEEDDQIARVISEFLASRKMTLTSPEK